MQINNGPNIGSQPNAGQSISMRMMQQKKARESQQQFMNENNEVNLYAANPFGGLNTVTPGGSGESDHTYNMGL